MDLGGRIEATVTDCADASEEGLGWSCDWAGFRTLSVHPRARGLGFGRRLLARCIENARRDDALAVGIHTAAFMERACGMCERAGFVRCPKHDFHASTLLGFDRSLGDQRVIAYKLALRRASA